MSITRRGALTAAVACGLATTGIGVAGADDQPVPVVPPPKLPERDPILSGLPDKVRAVCEDTFPRHRCVRLAERKEKGVRVHRVTVFDPFSPTAHSQQVGEEFVTTPILYHLELTADGKLIEETPHPVLDLKRVPKAVMDSYQKWNPRGVKGMAVMWWTELPKGKDRVYRVQILVNAIKAYDASFKEDGSVISAVPAEVP